MSERYDAVVVGSGPNGLTAAATLATNGWRVLVVEAAHHVGGAVATTDHGSVGWAHDVGSTIHALAALSPAYERLGIEDSGVEFVHFPVLLAHPLDGGKGAALYRDVDQTADGLGVDGHRYRRLIGRHSSHFGELRHDLLGPLIGWPRNPIALARFATTAALPMSVLRRTFRTDEAQALLAGSAAHSFSPLHHPLTASFALMLHSSGHAVGWPIVAGGSQRIAEALVEVIESHGGTVKTGFLARTLADLPDHDTLLLDTSPTAAAGLLGELLPKRMARRYRRYRHGPAAFKIDYELSGAIPWTYAPARTAGTVHVIGDYSEVAAAERATARGDMPDQPFVLVAQASLVDSTRAPTGAHTGWVYAHVPHGFAGDATSQMENQIERFAPGFRDLIQARHVTTPRTFEKDNPNLVGGDIGGGSYTGLQIIRRPRISRHPYRTGVPGVFLCSASTPPGAGAHGMSGYHAAMDALSQNR